MSFYNRVVYSLVDIFKSSQIQHSLQDAKFSALNVELQNDVVVDGERFFDPPCKIDGWNHAPSWQFTFATLGRTQNA